MAEVGGEMVRGLLKKDKTIDPRPDKPLFESTGTHELVARGLTQTFLDESGTEVWALDNFSCAVSGSEIVGIIGPSGCGKSTFLRLSGGA